MGRIGGGIVKIIVKKNKKNMGTEAAHMIADVIRHNPRAVLSLPTGSSPVECLEELVRMHKKEALDFSNVKVFNVDEYIGLNKAHPQSYYHFLDKNLYEHVNVDRSRTFVPDVQRVDPDQAASEYTKLINEEGGFDLILLGIGRDGHIAFNMPGSKMLLFTHVEKLSETTKKDNARFFGKIDQVPDEAISIGIKNILDSKKIILIASGKEKAEIVGRFLRDDAVTPEIPATFLKLHDDVTIILDEAAARQL